MKILRKGRVVVLLQGRYAGCKAVIVDTHEKSKKHPFGHSVVAGISKPPRRITRRMSNNAKKIKNKHSYFC